MGTKTKRKSDATRSPLGNRASSRSNDNPSNSLLKRSPSGTSLLDESLRCAHHLLLISASPPICPSSGIHIFPQLISSTLFIIFFSSHLDIFTVIMSESQVYV